MPAKRHVNGWKLLPPALVVSPFLIVAVQPVYEMSHKATKLLLSSLTGKATEHYQEIILPIELIVWQSSAQIRVFKS
jgi:DNA-binding LacI/PurR family transcriptional regulator